ncbi:MAG TPA: NADH-quinone oxidoreductase subunit L [Chitinophagales bacterium]|nr:NADH-quinone oxidoreductase subunit L [Chitinophagales bacterium]HMZ88350.1 NADH-quinone oxidoreductase subunit L [Chitinophagales bacterium]HNA57087.1 NADH-quinone oxidoreductase subunit L [Chitinophagales bacterium]HNE45363.1 NADH-quinone oxidoreductase subunit L [Chitinophagales bacterium]HNF68833.1 NADH-quinone oxidoreductase subunit L [Chitinophagales bacterium]
MSNYDYISLIPILPIAGFVLIGLAGKKYFPALSGWLATLLIGTSAVLSLFTAYQYFIVDGAANGVYPQLLPVDMQWLQFTNTLSINMGILLDPISVMMLVVVTFVSLMVHIYSTGYMKGESRYATFFAYLQLFTFSMLGLVMSSNLFQIYIFWELVGVSSFLLIGFYFDKPSAVAASKKAFIVTRFADLFFLIGILITGVTAHSFNFTDIIANLTSPEFLKGYSATFLGFSVVTWALVLIFIGGAGKSAMFPLHIWLPDAMEGPTPVSALIHAATMVVAGVYLVARLFPVFAITGSGAIDVVAYIGIFSALFAALIACTQTDIKRVLAYSTMSQIGYMMFALGVSSQAHDAGFTASMFHLFTHAFFKSLLFLGAGLVIHAVHSNDMKDMGGLRKYLPITHITFLIGCLAIAGVPPFAGFFSKEGILHAAYTTHPDIYYVALVTSGLTAFYMFRLYFRIFWNKADIHLHHFHGEGAWSMKFPLLILATLSIAAGFVPFAHYVTATRTEGHMHTDIMFSIAPVLIGLLGIAVAMMWYKNENDRADKAVAMMRGVYRTAYHKFYIDELYIFITKKVIFNCIGRPAAWIDRNIVDGTMNFIALMTGEISDSIKGMQSGKVQGYAMYFFAGVIGLTLICLYIWM